MAKRLTRIYTRNGDSGRTRLGDGTETAKSSLRIQAIGDIDELNCLVGLVRAESLPSTLAPVFEQLQHVLFDVGGELCMPGTVLVDGTLTTRLEETIDRINLDLGPLEEFILPGGCRSAACCHHARAVCRRAERTLVALAEAESIRSELLQLVNRLSDFLFTAARELNRKEGHPETYWKPENRRGPDGP